MRQREEGYDLMEGRVGGLDFGRFKLNLDWDQCWMYDKFLELQLRGGYKITLTQDPILPYMYRNNMGAGTREPTRVDPT
eukprot:6657408-Ditylum_brightwellii.AAC.1